MIAKMKRPTYDPASLEICIALHKRAVQEPCPPTCAKCGRQVDWFGTERNVVNDKLTMTARCHGQVETVELSYAEQLALGGFSFGLAFKDAGALPAKGEEPR